jgi:hypothetical protein
LDPAIDSLIIKPLRGHAGRGIVLAKKTGSAIVIQSKSDFMPLEDYLLTKPAIVQEVIKQDARMALFSSSSVNTIRFLTMYTKSGAVLVLAAALLCGRGESYLSNWSAGSVEVGVDIEKGRLMKYGYTNKGSKCTKHPTSKVTFEALPVPEWQGMMDLALRVQEGFPFYRMLGTDIALREDGQPVLIEVNNDPGFSGMEQTRPLLQDPQNLKAFGEYDLFINKHQRDLYHEFKAKNEVFNCAE